MPRISRNSVQFRLNGKTYLATFAHQHCEESKDPMDKVYVDEGPGNFRMVKRVIKPLVVPSKLGKMKLRHITTCTLREGATEVGMGMARCHVKDDYDWKKGIKASLRMAIAGAGLPEGPTLGAFYQELPVRIPDADANL